MLLDCTIVKMGEHCDQQLVVFFLQHTPAQGW